MIPANQYDVMMIGTGAAIGYPEPGTPSSCMPCQDVVE